MPARPVSPGFRRRERNARGHRRQAGVPRIVMGEDGVVRMKPQACSPICRWHRPHEPITGCAPSRARARRGARRDHRRPSAHSAFARAGRSRRSPFHSRSADFRRRVVWDRVLAIAQARPRADAQGAPPASACGLSQRKPGISPTSRHFADGIHARDWPDMDDRCDHELSGARHRPLDGGDVSDIQPAARRAAAGRPGPAKAIGGTISWRARHAQAAWLGANWAPWRSVATWYLWRNLVSAGRILKRRDSGAYADRAVR